MRYRVSDCVSAVLMFALLQPYASLVKLGGVVVALAAVFGAGYKAGSDHVGRDCEQRKAEIKAEYAKERTAQLAKIHAMREGLEQVERKKAERIAEIDRAARAVEPEIRRIIIEKPMYRECVADQQLRDTINADRAGGTNSAAKADRVMHRYLPGKVAGVGRDVGWVRSDAKARF